MMLFFIFLVGFGFVLGWWVFAEHPKVDAWVRKWLSVEAEKTVYALHPGYVISKEDGDQHWIGVSALVRLYGLKPGEYVVWQENRGYRHEDYEHLWPQFDGDYRAVPR